MVSKIPPLTVGMSTKEAIELVKADKTLKKELKDTVIFNLKVDASGTIDDTVELQRLRMIMNGEKNTVQRLNIKEGTEDWKTGSNKHGSEIYYHEDGVYISYWTPKGKETERTLGFDGSPNLYKLDKDGKIVAKEINEYRFLRPFSKKESIVDAPYDGVPDKKFEYDTKGKVVAEWNLDSDGEWIKAKK